MRFLPAVLCLALLPACHSSAPAVTPPALVLSDSVTVLDGATGSPRTLAALQQRIASADFVLLGELHDDAAHHRIRGALLAASTRAPAVVFEQFAYASGPVPKPAAGQSREAWLDANGFDRKAWRWPVHAPVVDAAVQHARAIRGSNVGREQLSPVIRTGLTAAPATWQAILAQTPLDSAGTAAAEAEIITGHCNQLPAAMVPGMRNAQLVRDAAMTDALLAAGADGPAWLIAGDGHVRADLGVPRLLRREAKGRSLLAVGFLERRAEGGLPPIEELRTYDVVVVTAHIPREDPCASLR